MAAPVALSTDRSAHAELASGSRFTLTSPIPIPITNAIGVAVSQNISAPFNADVLAATVNLTGRDTNGCRDERLTVETGLA